VRLQTVRAEAGRLVATLTATGSPATPNNRLRELHFRTGPNATVEVAGQAPRSGDFTVGLPDRPEQVGFSVQRAGEGTVHVQVVAVDDCGQWPTFVGGGPGAF
jgi:hypothetical protein